MNKNKDKRESRMLTAVTLLASALLSALEYVSRSSSWKRWFRAIVAIGTITTKGGTHA